MRITEVSVAAVAASAWIPVDYWQTPPAIGLAGFISSGAVLTWAVQYTYDDIGSGGVRPIRLSQATTVITVVDSGPSSRNGTHGLSVGDDVTIIGTGLAGVDGEYAVATVVSATSYTVTSGTSQTVANTPAQVVSARVFTHSVLTGKTARADGSLLVPVRGVRLNVTAYTSGTASLEVVQGGMSS